MESLRLIRFTVGLCKAIRLFPLAVFALATAMMAPRSAAAPGDVDSLDLNIVGSPAFVNATAIQPDGKIVIAGRFTSVLGTARSNIARINADGTLDATFDPKTNGDVYCLALQTDGKVVMGGTFTTLQPNGAASATTRNYLARVNADGTLDTAYDPRPNNQVYCLAVDSSGRMIVGGNFTTLRPNGAASATTRNYLARVNTSGTLDTSLDPTPNGTVLTVVVSPGSGNITFGGLFTTVLQAGAPSASPRNRIAQVTSVGAIVNGFNPNANGGVWCLALQPNGQVLLGGAFTTLQPNGAASATTRNRIARLNSDGTLDTGFDPNAPDVVSSIAVQVDGRISICGDFTTLQPNGAPAPVSRLRFAQLETNGTLINSFAPSANADGLGVMLQSDGKILAGGSFTTVNGTTRNRFARLVNDSGAQQPLAVTVLGSGLKQVDWNRIGALPEVSQVTFDVSSNGGVSWTPLGTAARNGTGSNWRITNLSIPEAGLLRARGRVTGGFQNGSSGIMETVSPYGPSMTIMGNGQVISSGDTTPSLADHTDFGDVLIGSSVERTFTVYNNGPTTLDFGPSPFAEISGPHAAEFTPLDNWASMASGSNVAARFRFTAGGPGLRTATVTIANNSVFTNPYTFTIQGNGIRPGTLAGIAPDSSSPNPSNAPTVTWFLGFGLPGVTGLSAANLSLTSSGLGGSPQITAITPVSGSFTSAWRVTASTGTGDGTLELRLANDTGLSHSISNLAGATSTFTIDRTPPTATIAISDHALTAGDYATVTMSFSEQVQGLGSVHFSAPNGVLTFVSQPDPATYLFDFIPNAGIVAPVNAVRLEFDPVGFSPIRDMAGNPGAGIVNSPNFTINTAELTPSVTSAATLEDVQTTTGLVLTRNVNDPSGLATYFKITNIANGTLYQNDGVTVIADGTFLTFAEANAGLRFTPAMDINGSAGFNVQASTTNSDAGLSNGVVPVAITVNPVNDPPLFVIGANRTHAAGTASAQSFSDGSTAISDGDPEVSQSLTFNVTNDNTSIFTTPPAIAADGTLSYTPNGTAGTAVVSVSLTDDATAGGVALTTAVQTFTIQVLSAAEIAVGGNSANITNGDTTPATADDTDFGSLNIADAPVVRTFTITNSGETDLSLTSAPLVQITGLHASDFTVTAQPVSPVAPAGFSNFTIAFDSSAAGLRSATVVLANSDADEAPFEFAIQGTGVISTSSELSSISLPGISLTPAFNPAVTSYTGSVPAGTTSISLTPSGESHGTIEVRVNGGSWTTVASGASTNLPLNPGANTVESRVTAQSGDVTTYTFIIHSGVLTPSITSASTDEDIQTSAGLVLTRNTEDPSGGATHFKITSITNGTLYQNDGVTPISAGGFITFSQGNAGLKFTPAANFNGSAGFNVQASTVSSDTGLSGAVVTASITVNPVNDLPVFVIGGNRIHLAGTASPQSFSDGATGSGDGDPEVSQSLAFNVSNNNASIFTTPPTIAADGTLTYTPNGTAGTAVVSVSLTDDATAGGVALTTAVQTFVVTVAAASNDSTLSSIAIGGVVLTPAFSPATTAYTATVPAGTTGVTVTPASGESNASIDARVNGGGWTPVASGNPSGNLPLSAGVNAVEVRVTAQDGSVTIYTFTITVEGGAEIAVSGHGENIANGDMTPASLDRTDIGTVNVAGHTAFSNFTIANSGTGLLTLGGSPLIQISGAHAADFTVTAQPAASIAAGGSTVFTVTFDPSASGLRTALVSIGSDDSDENPFTFAIQGTGVATIAGDFDPLNASITGSLADVWAIAVQPDGKILIGGTFTNVRGVARQNLARLNADGTLDSSFYPRPNGAVYAIAQQPDGKILIGGTFTSVQPNGAPTATTRNRCARLNADGTLDTGFDPNFNNFVLNFAVQPDGKILIGGNFGTIRPNGAATSTSRPFICRVNANGTLDVPFHPRPNSNVYALRLLDDGKMLIGGHFTTLTPNGAPSATLQNFIAKLNADGTLDSSFNPNPLGRVNSIVVQPDGRILLAGAFTSLQPNGAPAATPRGRIARVHPDGTLDTGFHPNANGDVLTLALQADGRIIAGGAFTTLQPNGATSSATRNRAARLLPDGALDAAFDINLNEKCYAAALQPDGRCLLGGPFTSLQPNGAAFSNLRTSLTRVLNDEAVQSLTHTGIARVDWLRSGSSAELSSVSFEQSTDGGTVWTPLGSGTRSGTSANWELTGLTLPTTGLLRARGITAQSGYAGSYSVLESVSTITSSLTPIQMWRQLHFGSSANSGNAANDFDADGDGLANLVEFAFAQDPNDPSEAAVPALLSSEGSVGFSFSSPPGVGGITYIAEWSTTLAPGSWTSIPDTGTAPTRLFQISTAGQARLFIRIRISED